MLKIVELPYAIVNVVFISYFQGTMRFSTLFPKDVQAGLFCPSVLMYCTPLSDWAGTGVGRALFVEKRAP